VNVNDVDVFGPDEVAEFGQPARIETAAITEFVARHTQALQLGNHGVGSFNQISRFVVKSLAVPEACMVH